MKSRDDDFRATFGQEVADRADEDAEIAARARQAEGADAPQEAERDLADLLGAYSGLDHYRVIEYRLADTRRILANAAHAAAIAMALSPYGESA